MEKTTTAKSRATNSQKGRKRITEYQVVRLNEPPLGLLEDTLAMIYARRIRNGTLNIDAFIEKKA